MSAYTDEELAERGQTLKQLVAEALEEKLAARPGRASPDEPSWIQGFEKLRRLHEETPGPLAWRRRRVVARLACQPRLLASVG